MLTIPFQVKHGVYNVFVVLPDESIDRIKQYDPAQLVTGNLGKPWTDMRLGTVIIGYCTAQERGQVIELARQGRAGDALQLLSRGFKYQPEKGDHDDEYKSVFKTG